MGKKTLLQSIIFLAIQQMPTGTMIRLPEFYKKIEDFLKRGSSPGAAPWEIAFCHELQKCADLGDLPREPRLNNDV